MSVTQRSDDDLTHKLKDIVKANLQLLTQEQSGAPQHIVNEFCQLLQYHCATFVCKFLRIIIINIKNCGEKIYLNIFWKNLICIHFFEHSMNWGSRYDD